MSELDERRRNVITGTDMCILLGAVPSSWGTPLDVYLHKKNLDVPRPTTHRMMLGHLAEPYIALMYEKEKLGNTAVDGFLMDGNFVQHTLFPLGGTPDRFVGCTGGSYGLEIKYTTVSDGWGPSGSDQVPDRVRTQCQHYMLITGFTRWDVAALINNDEIRYYTLCKDPVLHEQMTQVACDFWDKHVIPGIPPPPEKADYSPLLRTALSGSSASGSSVPEGLRILGTVLTKLKQKLKAAQAEVDEATEEFKEQMHENGLAAAKNGWSAKLGVVNPSPKTVWENVAKAMEQADPVRYKALCDIYTEQPPSSIRFTFTPRANGDEPNDI